MTRVASRGRSRRGVGRRAQRLFQSGSARSRLQQAAIGVGRGAHAAGRLPAPAQRAPASAVRRRRTAPRAGSCASSPRASARCASSPRAFATGTWCERQKSSTFLPSTSFGPVQPFGLRSTIIGQRGRSSRPLGAARLVLDRARCGRTPCRACRPCSRCMSAGSLPSTKNGS